MINVSLQVKYVMSLACGGKSYFSLRTFLFLLFVLTLIVSPFFLAQKEREKPACIPTVCKPAGREKEPAVNCSAKRRQLYAYFVGEFYVPTLRARSAYHLKNISDQIRRDVLRTTFIVFRFIMTLILGVKFGWRIVMGKLGFYFTPFLGVKFGPESRICRQVERVSD